MMSDIAGFFEAVDSRIGRLSLVTVAAVGCIKNVVDDLECNADAITEDLDLLEIRSRGPAEVRTDPDANADQGSRLRPVNRFQLLRICRRDFRLNIQHLTGDHSANAAGRTAERHDHL